MCRSSGRRSGRHIGGELRTNGHHLAPLSTASPRESIRHVAHHPANSRGGRSEIAWRDVTVLFSDVLDLLAAGLNREHVLDELPDLQPGDVAACLQFVPASGWTIPSLPRERPQPRNV
ncbi:MAG: DUF433 domain-containing protein [Acidobacteria bacterium]|nr:DUF433 domain-containing protein [Acidobacteriota bacterium]